MQSSEGAMKEDAAHPSEASSKPKPTGVVRERPSIMRTKTGTEILFAQDPEEGPERDEGSKSDEAEPALSPKREFEPTPSQSQGKTLAEKTLSPRTSEPTSTGIEAGDPASPGAADAAVVSVQLSLQPAQHEGLREESIGIVESPRASTNTRPASIVKTSSQMSLRVGGSLYRSGISNFHDLISKAVAEHDREVADLQRQLLQHGSFEMQAKGDLDQQKYPWRNGAETLKGQSKPRTSELTQNTCGLLESQDLKFDACGSEKFGHLNSLTSGSVQSCRSSAMGTAGGLQSGRTSIYGTTSVAPTQSASAREAGLVTFAEDACIAMTSSVSGKWKDQPAPSQSATSFSEHREDSTNAKFILHDLWINEDDYRRNSMRSVMSTSSHSKFKTTSRSHSMFSKADVADRKKSVANGSEDGSVSNASLAPNAPNHSWKNCLDRLVVFPNSAQRVVWDILGALFLMLDILLIPLEAFQQKEQFKVVEIINWVSLNFWTLDILASIFVGYAVGGKTEMRFSRIFVHYCKTWMPTDVFIVGVEWFILIANSTSGVASLSGLMRSLRLLRVLRLVRMLKMTRIMRQLSDLLASEHTSIIANIMRLVLVLLLVNHGVACFWFWLGILGKDNTWISQYNVERGFAYSYFTSMHWSLTQFTPGSMEITPQNVHERVYNVCVLVFGLLVFSCFVSSMTNHFMRLKALVNDQSEQFWLLRCYLKQNHAPPHLCSRIYRHVEFVLKQKNEMIASSRVKLLEYISDDLQKELSFAMFKDTVLTHPFFYRLFLLSDIVVMRVCGDACSYKMFARSDAIFFQAELGSGARFLVAGTSIYTTVVSGADRKSGGSCSGESLAGSSDAVEIGSIISEPSLWSVNWLHRGRLHAKTECNTLKIDSAGLRVVVEASPSVWYVCRSYAFNFVTWLNQQADQDLTDIVPLRRYNWQIHAFLPEDEMGTIDSVNKVNSKTLKTKLSTIRASFSSNHGDRASNKFGTSNTGGSKQSGAKQKAKNSVQHAVTSVVKRIFRTGSDERISPDTKLSTIVGSQESDQYR